EQHVLNAAFQGSKSALLNLRRRFSCGVGIGVGDSSLPVFFFRLLPRYCNATCHKPSTTEKAQLPEFPERCVRRFRRWRPVPPQRAVPRVGGPLGGLPV